MPTSARDRPTLDYEHIFLLTKRDKYYYNQDAIREPYTKPMNRWGGQILIANGISDFDDAVGQNTYRHRNMRPNPLGRNRRSVWSIASNKNTDKKIGKHYATYPEELIKICVLAGSKEGDIVFDPFVGSGTTVLVANKLNRLGVGLDLSMYYLTEIAQKRIENAQLHGTR